MYKSLKTEWATITTHHGRIVAKQTSERRWVLYVDGSPVFKTHLGMSGIQRQINYWSMRLDAITR